jgi:ribosomal protein S18 acetylase RimI-like enzyme
MIVVENTTPVDLPLIFSFFEHSADYQEKNGYPSWRNYDRDALINDIKAGNQYKVVAYGQPAMVFSVRYSDRVIWREREAGDSLYIHRMVVNPACKGKRLFGEVLDWATRHAKSKGLRFVRMDTWADNPPLISYYASFGFRFVEHFTLPDSPELPVHNRGLRVALLEFAI